MLDFCFISDDRPERNKFEKPDLELAGQLDENTFEELQAKNIIDLRIDYYCSSFHWDTSLIRQIQDKLAKVEYNRIEGIKQFARLLEKTAIRQSGLIVYGD